MVSTFLRRVNIGGGVAAMLVNRKSPVFQKNFMAADSTRTKTIYSSLNFVYWPTCEEKESILNQNVFSAFGYSFMRLKPSGPSILRGDGSTTQKKKKKKKKRDRERGRGDSRMKKRALGTGSGWFWPSPPRLPYIIYQHFKLLEHLIAAKT